MPSSRGFPKSARLCDNKVFVELLRGRRKASGCLEIATRPRVDAAQGGPRLGIVVGKKNLPGSVERNTLKRIIREAFRTHLGLPRRDIIVRLRQRLNVMPRSAWKAEAAAAVRTLLDGTRA